MCTTCDNLTQTKTTKWFPRSEKFKTDVQFEDGEPNISEDEERPETYESRQWKKENREAWQLHSGLGPNLQAESTSNVQESLPEVVNPQDHKWETFHGYFKDFAPENFWDKIRNTSTGATEGMKMHKAFFRK